MLPPSRCFNLETLSITGIHNKRLASTKLASFSCAKPHFQVFYPP